MKTAIFLGKAGEYRVFSELLLRGFNPGLCSIDNGIDIILSNGITIQVKTTNRNPQWGKSYVINNMSARYIHNQQIKVKREIITDFIIIWIIKDNDFYIIPSKEITTSTAFCVGSKIGKYYKYKNRWDLIKEGVK